MQFLKKNYEKVLLGLVLFGLVAAVAFLPFLVEGEKQRLTELRDGITSRKVLPMAPLDTKRGEDALGQVATRLTLDLSGNHKLFNPVRWLKGPNGPIKMPAGSELEKLEVTRMTPLYLVLSLESVSVSDASGARYEIVVEQQASPRQIQRGRRPYYVSINDKKDLFAVREAKGPQNNPTALVLELNDTGETASISKGNDFKRVDGYTVDLRYAPENKSFLGRRAGDKISVGGEEYTIANITQNEVILSARSNGKKYTIRYNAAP